MEQLTPTTFLAGVELIQQQLRVKREDRWSDVVCKLKFHSFQSEFPEVNDAQFFWACEQWVQAHSHKDFSRFPVWAELMTSLYATENGKANRSWGFKRELPPFVAPTDEQKTLLPGKPRSIAGAADPTNTDAYVPFEAEAHPLLPPVVDNDEGISREEWAQYLRHLAEEVNGTTD
jgi:hypothetical protein